MEAVRPLGVTTRAILEAPHNEVYIWGGADTSYPRLIAEGLGRGDIVFASVFEELKHVAAPNRAVVVDHAVDSQSVKQVRKHSK